MFLITAHLGARELPKSSGSKKERKKRKKLKELGQSERKHRNNDSGPYMTSVLPPPFIFFGVKVVGS
jgi:hypothetical protein